MAMISPSEGKKFERDPEEGNFPSGVYVMYLERIQEVGPSKQFPNGNPRLVFEFGHRGGQYAGKKAAIFVGKTLFKDPKTNKESGLVKLARSMGVVAPEKGFDPETLMGRAFTVMTEHQDGRSWVRTAMPAAEPAAQSAPPPAASGPPPRRQPPAAPPDPLYYLAVNPDAEPVKVPLSRIKAMWEAEGLAQEKDAAVCPDGGSEWKPITEAIPDSKGWVPF